MRQEFSRKTKLEAWSRSGGFCECGCAQKILSAEYHHIVPAAFGGANTLDNCRVLDRRCHRKLTAEVDVPRIAKAARIEAKRAGLRKRRPFPKRIDPWGKGL